MNWELYIVKGAKKQLSNIQTKEQKQILNALQEMQEDPFSGDVKWLKNQPHTFRRRVGTWRILFDLDYEIRLILVGDIVRRDDKTYR